MIVGSDVIARRALARRHLRLRARFALANRGEQSQANEEIASLLAVLGLAMTEENYETSLAKSIS